jgi:RNA polymerase sigma factor FliA
MFSSHLPQPKKTNDYSNNVRYLSRAAARQARATTTLGVVNPESRDPRVDARCAELMPLLTRVAARFARRLPAHIELDDLIGAGAIGMLTAVRQHIDKPTDDLSRLVERRVRGAILDYLRESDHLSRRQRAAVSAVNRAKAQLAQDGESLESGAVAKVLGITVARAENIESRFSAVAHASLEDTGPIADGRPSMDDELAERQTCETVGRALVELPERMQMLLSLHYVDDLTYGEIGKVLGISRSRVCQLHTQAIEALQKKLAKVA